MQIKLSQKERMLLEDGKKQEELCVKKYLGYASQVQDVQLKNLLTEIAQEEQHHLDMINEMLQGKAPNMSHSGGKTLTSQGNNLSQGIGTNADDKTLLEDLLSTEKYVSSFMIQQYLKLQILQFVKLFNIYNKTSKVMEKNYLII